MVAPIPDHLDEEHPGVCGAYDERSQHTGHPLKRTIGWSSCEAPRPTAGRRRIPEGAVGRANSNG
jgi:hypothetical protein